MDLINFKVGNENFKDPDQSAFFSGIEMFCFDIKPITLQLQDLNLRGKYHQQMANSSRNMQK